ncbi:hypothetical protein QN277_019714 [Acacia crassicarpa]|uniref:Uncharacterized protein n=1 Tax=Acacia crassicarpa TaxID=499986 RepID=A0AAE1KDS3_9FABA|nr:hypothetical protein QN277_019714 [Acacia crassicarpa]
MADKDEDLPRDAKIVQSLLKSMGVEDYEPCAIHKFLALWYRYAMLHGNAKNSKENVSEKRIRPKRWETPRLRIDIDAVTPN